MIQARRDKFINMSFFILLFSLLIYIIARAVTVGMTHDEAYSFHNVKKFWYAEVLCTGNSHWFNLAAIKAALLAGLDKTWQIRWFGMFSAAIFLWIAFVWIKTLKDFATGLFVLAFGLLNPYLLDYLSLARGYSTGLMFEALSLLFFVLSNNRQSRRDSFLALFFASASAIANFNFFYFFSAFCLVYFYLNHFKKGRSVFRQIGFYIDAILAIATALVVLRALLFIHECSNDIADYGGQSFVPSVFTSFINCLFYRNVDLSTLVVSILAWVLFAFIIISCMSGLFYKRHKNFLYFISSAILIFMFLFTVFNKITFNVLFPTDRTLLMFFPLFAIVITCFFKEFLKHELLKKVLFLGACKILIANFFLSINFKSVLDYPQQADAKECFDFLRSQNAKRVGIDPEVFGVFTNYYQLTSNPYPFYGESIHTYLPNTTGTEKDKLLEFDYIVLIPPYNLSYYKNNSITLKKVKVFPYAHTVVLKVGKRE